MYKSTILLLPQSTCIGIDHTIAMLLHDFCIAQHPHPPPPGPLFVYTIHHKILVMAVSCKGQSQVCQQTAQ